MMDNQELQAREKKELKHGGEATREGPHFSPEVDIYEQVSALTLIADVPGASNEGISLDLQDNVLTLTATVPAVEPQWKPVYREYEVGHYTREFRIGQLIDSAKISAQVKDGVLRISLPKIEKAVPRKIQIKSDE